MIICLLSAMVMIAMSVIDKNQGEAGIASSAQARFFKLALGISIVSAAGALASALFYMG